jgi:hypothetical protein
MADSPTFSPGDAHREESAGEFLTKMAAEIQGWLHDNTHSGTDAGMQWVLTATLADGTQMVIYQLSAHGHSLIKLRGQLADGRPGLLISHLHSVQFLASYIPRAAKQPEKREIGFHTGMGKDIKIERLSSTRSLEPTAAAPGRWTVVGVTTLWLQARARCQRLWLSSSSLGATHATDGT